jgi:hypothetical protein
LFSIRDYTDIDLILSGILSEDIDGQAAQVLVQHISSARAGDSPMRTMGLPLILFSHIDFI